MKKPTLKATIAHAENAKQPGKPLVDAYSYIVRHKGTMREAITVRVYMSASRNASMVYACVWVRCADGQWTSGKGNAGGYGYHKESTAIADAARSAGIRLYGHARPRDGEPVDMTRSFDFGGTGDSYYPDVFAAIVRAAGYRTADALMVHHS